MTDMATTPKAESFLGGVRKFDGGQVPAVNAGDPDPSDSDGEEPATLDDILHEIQEERLSAMRWRIAFFVVGALILIGIGRLPSALRDAGFFRGW